MCHALFKALGIQQEERSLLLPSRHFLFFKKKSIGTSLVVHWPRLHAPNAGPRMSQLRPAAAINKQIYIFFLKIDKFI